MRRVESWLWGLTTLTSPCSCEDSWLTCAVGGHRFRLRWEALGHRGLQSWYKTLNSNISFFFCNRAWREENKGKGKGSQRFSGQFCAGFLVQVSKMPVSSKMGSTVSYCISAAFSVWASPIEHVCARVTLVASLGEPQCLQVNAEWEPPRRSLPCQKT